MVEKAADKLFREVGEDHGTHRDASLPRHVLHELGQRIRIRAHGMFADIPELHEMHPEIVSDRRVKCVIGHFHPPPLE